LSYRWIDVTDQAHRKSGSRPADQSARRPGRQPGYRRGYKPSLEPGHERCHGPGHQPCCKPGPVAASVIALLVVSGCGVGPQQRPEPLSNTSANPTSIATARPTPPPSNSPTATTDAVVFLVRGSRLVAVRRPVPLDAGPGSRLAALTAGPTPIEATAGLTSAIPRSIPIEVQVAGSTAMIRLPRELDDLTGTTQLLALAQLVYTATADAHITAVQLTNGTRPVDVPTGSGHLVRRPVTRADYATMAPP
jgi:Sporulation and spore germination